MGYEPIIITAKGQVNISRERAYWFQAEDSELPVWLPKSQCEWDEEDGYYSGGFKRGTWEERNSI